MGHVKGIGGLFFRARDPEALNAWYRDRLGVGGGISADDSAPVNQWVWTVTGAPLVFSPFTADTDYFPADLQYMINLPVANLAAVPAPLSSRGAAGTPHTGWERPRRTGP